MDMDETYWKVKARRERNVEEGLKFNGAGIPADLLAKHDIEYQKLAEFIVNYKDEISHEE